MKIHEVHVERLLGRKVTDADGKVVGRIEEMRSAIVDGERVVTEFHIGPAALLERVGLAFAELPIVGWLASVAESRSVPWYLIDLEDPRHPRLLGRLHDVGKAISRSDIPSHPS